MNNVKLILGAAVKVYEVIMMLLLMVLTFSALGYLIMIPVPNDTYYTTFYDSFVNTFTLMTTVNFPDVALPSYRYNRAYGIFFIVYLFTALYLILNLSLALIYSYYKKGAASASQQVFKLSKSALVAAFKYLDEKKHGYIDYEQWEQFFKVFKPKASPSLTKAVYNLLDTQCNNVLTAIEFMKLDECLRIRLTRKNVWYKRILRRFSSIYHPRIPMLAKVLHSK